MLFLIKGVAEFFGGNLIEYVGLSGITDMRNQVYGKLVQQPVGFFHGNPVGRVMSAVISDIEQIRSRIFRLPRGFLPPDFRACRVDRRAAGD